MSQQPDVPALLSIGIRDGGAADKGAEVARALGRFMRMVVRERAAFPNEGLRLNIVFHVPGAFSQPDYVGVHATRLDRRSSHLLVVSGVPAGLAVGQVPAYLGDVLSMAFGEASAYLAKRKLQIETSSLQALIAHLIKDLQANST